VCHDIKFCTNCGENKISSCSPQRKGVCQGCGLRLYFFNILVNNIEYFDIQGICSLVINGLIIPGLLFADDLALASFKLRVTKWYLRKEEN